MNDFFTNKRGWISQLFDSHGNHVGTRQFLFKDKAHLIITTYDINDCLQSSEHIFPMYEGESWPYEFLMQVTTKLAESENSKMFNPDSKRIIT